MPHHTLKRGLRAAQGLSAALLAVAACWSLPATAQGAAGARAAPVYTGNYIVRWRDGSQPATSTQMSTQMRNVEANTGLALGVKRSMAGTLQLMSVTDTKGDNPETVAKRLRQDPRIADAVPDRWLRLHDSIPNDPEFASAQTYMALPSQVVGAANLTRAWDRSRGNASIVVAVVDTGYLPHPDLIDRLVPGYDFISTTAVSNDGDGRDSDPIDPGDFVPAGQTCQDGSGQANSTWHGTRVASVLGALTNNGVGIAGVDWAARIQPVRVSGRCGALLSDTVDGMRWAGGLAVPGVPANPTPAKVVNISLGGGSCSSIEQQAVNDLNAAGVVVVAAAGNSAGAVEAPADCTGVIAVTAHANDGENASFANVGPQVALSAPGGGCGNSRVVMVGNTPTCSTPGGSSLIRTLSNSGTTTAGNFVISNSAGTSFAAPMVSGVVSMMFAVNGALTPAQVTAGLKSSARAHPANTYCTASANVGKCGAGLLDADGALVAAANPAATATPAPAPVASDSGGGGGGGGAIAPWSAVVLLGIGVVGFGMRRRVR